MKGPVVVLLLPLVLSLLMSHVCCAPRPYSTTLESELRTSLFNGYEVLQRPAQIVPVFVALNLFTINDLDIRSQKLSITGYFSMVWKDLRLEWRKNSTYNNIKNIFSSETFTWRPAIVVENSVGNLKVMSDPNTLIRVVNTGTAVWTPGGIYETNCEADVTYYPLDTQECSIILSTWAYTAGEVTLALQHEPFIMEQYTENGEWEIVDTTTSSTSKVRKGDANSYSRLYYTIKLRRRPLFHILNTIFPVILMASLIVFVFKLPPESGERVGMSLTVLLAYAVYLTLISESIPRTSLSASILSTYLSIILMLSALSVIFTIIVLDVYFNHEDDESPPVWLQKFTRYCLVRCALWKDTSCCPKSNRAISPSIQSDMDSLNDTVVTDEKQDVSQDVVANQRFGKMPEKGSKEAWVTEEEPKVYGWKEMALIMDRCFMYLFVFLVTSATVGCFAILGTKY